MNSRMMFLDCPTYLDENTGVFSDAAAVAAAQARILSEDKQVPPESAQVVRAMAREQGFW